MQNIIYRYTKLAKAVLKHNRSEGYTLPSASLYPHQWNWDSGFIAIGYSHYDSDGAIKELTSLFNAQWKNGMLPQIVFNRKKLGKYFPEPDFWQAERSPHAPENLLTSGITMPPIQGISVLKIYENAPDKKQVIPFLKWIYPKLVLFHRYLYAERSLHGDGLVYIRHPWESGMDNSPAWDKVLGKVDLSGKTLPAYKRKDTSTGVSPEMRPTKEYYDYFVFLVDLFRKARYDEMEIRKECPFLVCGPLFNAILCASNEALIKIGDILKKPTRETEEWYHMTAKAIREKLFNEKHGIFDAYDLHESKLLELETASGFMPLFGGAASGKQAERLYEYLNSKSFCALHQGNCFTIPSYDTQKEGFKRENYWRGPVWININWMLLQGLRRYGFVQKADSLALDILQLPIRFGFHEYFDSFDGRGYGSRNFSWTASLFIDTAYETYIKTGRKSLTIRLKNILVRERVLNATEEKVQITGVKISQEMLKAIRQLKANYYSPQGTVNYETLRKSEEYREYKKIAASLRDFDPVMLQNESEKLAFWINLYNTIVIDGIIATDIKESVKEVTGFFSRIKYHIDGHTFSPDDIEHGILRANRRLPFRPFHQFGPLNPKKNFSLKAVDPRIHFALVCGSRSCAPIQYYSPERIDEELETAALNFINSSEVIVIPEENRILISQIFNWYSNDFGGTSGIINFIKRYILDEDKKKFLENTRNDISIDYLYYDWNLNK
jgi:hypothetical protein